MSRVAEILIAQANAQADAARQRGAIWGGALSNIGQSIAAIPGQMQQEKRQDALMLLEQARDARARGEEDRAKTLFAQSQREYENDKAIHAVLFADPAHLDFKGAYAKAIELGADPAKIVDLEHKLKPQPIKLGADESLIDPTTFKPLVTGPPKIAAGSLAEYVTTQRAALKAAGKTEQPNDLLTWTQAYRGTNRTNADAALDAYAKSLGKTQAEDLTDAERQAYAKRQATIASNQSYFQHTRERAFDIANPIPEKPKSQPALEQEYRTILARGLSSRSGGLGLEDAKVQQANHLLALLDQAYDPKTDTYALPKTLQGELAAGLARLVAPGGQVGIEMMREFDQKTAKGDLAGALSYVTGHPFPTASQDFAKLLRDSIERQGAVSEQNREGEMAYLRGLAPTDLDESRRQALERTSLNPLRRSRVIQNQQTGERRRQVSTDGGKTWQ